MQFSPTLQMAAIRARPSSPTVSLHVHPQALPGLSLPEAGFELGGVLLNARGHIETVRLTPTRLPLPRQAAAAPLSRLKSECKAGRSRRRGRCFGP